jgi:hypothetical protein
VGEWARHENTIELPDAIFRKPKATAAKRAQSLKSFFAEVVSNACGTLPGPALAAALPWEGALGRWRAFDRENLRIDRLISAEFETIEEVD